MVHLAGPMGLKENKLYQAAYWKAFEDFFGKQNSAVVKAMMLAKNPTGFNEILRTANQLGSGRHYLIALNDRLAALAAVNPVMNPVIEALARLFNDVGQMPGVPFGGSLVAFARFVAFFEGSP